MGGYRASLYIRVLGLLIYSSNVTNANKELRIDRSGCFDQRFQFVFFLLPDAHYWFVKFSIYEQVLQSIHFAALFFQHSLMFFKSGIIRSQDVQVWD
jgi:hypothetical protein